MRAAAASRTLPSPPTTTTIGASVASASAARVASSVPASIRGVAPEMAPDGIRDGVHDALATHRIDEPRRPRIDEDERISEGVGRAGHDAMLRDRDALDGTIPGIPARLAPANDPQVTREPGKHENRLARTVFPSPLPDDLVPRRHPLNPAPPGFATSFRARPQGGTARRAPSATSWQEGAPLRTRHLGARAFIPVALAGAVLFSLAPSTPAAASTTTEAQQIVRIAEWQVGDPWRYGATGPSSFDCSGLVLYAYRKAGDGAAIHSTTLRSARALYLWFRSRGLASRTNPKVGDLVIWGYGTHVGIYIGNGRPSAR